MEFNVSGNGWKFMLDIYRYIALQATQKTGKPVIIKKGRQVGATMMAGALDLYFTNSEPSEKAKQILENPKSLIDNKDNK